MKKQTHTTDAWAKIIMIFLTTSSPRHLSFVRVKPEQLADLSEVKVKGTLRTEISHMRDLCSQVKSKDTCRQSGGP